MQNNTSRQRILISCLVIFTVMCVCLSLGSIVGAGVIYTTQTSKSPAGVEVRETESQPVEVEVDQQLSEIESQIVELRGWEPKADVAQNFLTPSELRQHVLDDFLEDYSAEEAQEDALVLWAFGLLDRDFDLYNFFVDLYSEQVAGFYDSETKEMFIVQDNAFTGPERVTYAHEFVHALQDQYFDIENGLRVNDKVCETDSERCAAVSALLEGDASLTEAFWFSSYASKEDQREIARFYNNFEMPIYDQAPDFMKEDFIFPYQQGQAFVETLYDLGGWEAINQAYEDPPVSTEQILHPELYPDNRPVTVNLPDFSPILGQEWKEIDRGVLGEWYTYLTLAAGNEESGRIRQSQAADAAAGWSGDQYVVFYHESQDNIVMVISTTWDSIDEAAEFQAAFEEYAASRFGESIAVGDGLAIWQGNPGVHSLWIEQRSTTWMFAPDQQMMDNLLLLMQPR